MRKGFWSRLAAGVIDLAAGFFLCYLIHWHIGRYFALRAVVTLHIGEPGTIWKGTIPWIMGMFGEYVYTLPFALFLVFLPEAIWGRSIGKLVLRIKIAGEPKKLWLRYFIKTIGLWGMTLALVLGIWQLLIFFLGLGIIVIFFNLQDRLTRTTII